MLRTERKKRQLNCKTEKTKIGLFNDDAYFPIRARSVQVSENSIPKPLICLSVSSQKMFKLSLVFEFFSKLGFVKGTETYLVVCHSTIKVQLDREKEKVIKGLCINNRPSHNVSLNYILSFFRRYKDRPRFAFSSHAEISHNHDNYINTIGYVDEYLKIFL